MRRFCIHIRKIHLRNRSLIAKGAHIHIAADAVDLAGAGVLPATIVGPERREFHLRTILRHPACLRIDVRIVQRPLQVARVGVHAEILVTAGLQRAIPSIDDAVIHVRIVRRRVPGPRPTLKVVVHGVFQVVRSHAKLAELGHHIVALLPGTARILRIRVPVDAERNTQPLAFINVALRFGIGVIAPSKAKTDDRAFHAAGFRLSPIDIPLP